MNLTDLYNQRQALDSELRFWQTLRSKLDDQLPSDSADEEYTGYNVPDVLGLSIDTSSDAVEVIVGRIAKLIAGVEEKIEQIDSWEFDDLEEEEDTDDE